MNKPKMLYASPFIPLRSGISDYSKILIYALKEKFDITLYTDNYNIEDRKIIQDFEILKYGVNEINFDCYQYHVYNIGNNPYFHEYIYESCLKYPGLVILHDLILYYLFVGYYQNRNQLYSKTYETAGMESFLKIKAIVKENSANLLEQKHIAIELPLNQELLKSQNKIMVHSKYTYDKVCEYTNKVKQINMIQQVEDNFQLIDRNILFTKYNIPEDAIIISSFGIIGETKLNHIACQVILQIEKIINQQICYVMVGDGYYINNYVDSYRIFKTGYVEMDEFNSFIMHSDIILNLRYPSMGETSAALIKILQMGKVCIINDDGWFSEIPDECAIKVSTQNIKSELKDKILEYISNNNKRNEIGNNAKEYIKTQYNSKKIVNEITSFLLDN